MKEEMSLSDGLVRISIGLDNDIEEPIYYDKIHIKKCGVL